MKKPLPEGKKLNCVLQSRSEIDIATSEINNYGLISHALSCKDWDIIRILPRLNDGNILDLGADGSFILQNLVNCGHEGLKYGIDLLIEDRETDGIKYFKGDLMNTPFEDNLFQYITCLSVIEHQVNYTALSKECARLLKSGGELFITCDFWNPKPDTSLTKLYSLDWNILDQQNINELIDEMKKVGLRITSDFDFTQNEDVINPTYCSPVQGVSYSFAILHFVKD